MKFSVIYGWHASFSVLNKHPERIHKVLLLKERENVPGQKALHLAEKNNIKVEFKNRHEMDQLSEKSCHQGILLYCYPPKKWDEKDLEEILAQTGARIFLLLLDGIQDPHNLGACLRVADAAGVQAVIAPKDKSVGLTPAVCKVASGAAESIPFIQVTNLARTMEWLKEKNIWLFGAEEESEKNLYTVDLKVNLGLVLGQEGKGLRRLTRETCDALVKIPMQGFVSSLNVSVATGVFCFEVVRQRLSARQ